MESECPKCGGRGLHPGYGVRNGNAMQCLVCFGRGFLLVKIVPFLGLKRIEGVEHVFRGRGSRGDWKIYGKGVPYAEFLEYEDSLLDPHGRLFVDAGHGGLMPTNTDIEPAEKGPRTGPENNENQGGEPGSAG